MTPQFPTTLIYRASGSGVAHGGCGIGDEESILPLSKLSVPRS